MAGTLGLISYQGGRPRGDGHRDEIIDDHTGLIKYDVWEFEQEIRLKAALKERLYTVSREPSPEYIYAGIDKELIQDFHITYNPWMSPEMKDVVKNSLNEKF